MTEYQKQWCRSNPEKLKEYHRRWLAKHGPRNRGTYLKEYREKNQEAIKQKSKVKYLLNREDNLKQKREYYLQNKDAVIAKVMARHAKKKQVTVGNLEHIRKIYKRAKELSRNGFDVHVDHIIPIALGGHHATYNLQIIYAKENWEKRANLYYQPSIIFQ